MTANLINYWSFNESRRHNQAMEELNRGSLAETYRHNIAVETESHRSNLAREFETMRSNIAHETETNRHNLVVENETERSNRANEAIRRESNAIGWANVSLGYAQLAEHERHNRATEDNDLFYKQSVVSETNRHNIVMEKQNAASTIISHSEYLGKQLLGYQELDVRRQSADETARHNLVTEGIADYDARTRRTVAESQAFKNYTEGGLNIAKTLPSILFGGGD